VVIDKKIFTIPKDTYEAEYFTYTDAMVFNFLYVYTTNTAINNASVIIHHLYKYYNIFYYLNVILIIFR